MARQALRIQKGPLSPESVLVAQDELRETPERTKEALAQLRRLLASKNTMRFPDHDEFLLRFLRPTKFYPESAYKLMEAAASFKDKYSEVVGGLMPSDEEQTLCENNVINILANRDRLGRRILLVNLGELWNPSKVTALQVFRCLYIFHVVACLEPDTQVNGIVAILNLQGFGTRQLLAISPSQAKMRFTFYQKAMPLRLKQIHIVNEPSAFSAALRILKPFMQDKMQSRLFCHGKHLSGLHDHLDPGDLPEDLGGSGAPMDYSSKDWYPEIRRTESAMTEWNSFGFTRESKED